QVVAGGQRVWVFGAQCFGAELVGPLENGVGEVVAALRPQGTSDAVGDVGLSVVQGCVDGGVGDVVVGAAGALGVVDDVVGHRDVLTGVGEQSGGGTRNRGGSPFPGLTQCFGGVAGVEVVGVHLLHQIDGQGPDPAGPATLDRSGHQRNTPKLSGTTVKDDVEPVPAPQQDIQ